MKIALITDSHCGARNDSVVFSKYFDKFYYEQFFPYLEEHNIKQIIHLGDIVDKRKSISYISKSYLRRFVQACDDRGIALDVIIGNHDIPNKGNLKNHAMVELFSHSKYNVKYFDKPQDIKYDGLTICMIPWICADNYQDCMDHIQNTKSKILFGHLEVQGFEMYRGSVNQHGLKASTFDKFDTVFSGHFHHKSTKGNISYLGSPFEITWGDWNDPRGFHIFDTETLELTYIQNPYKMFHKIFYSDDLQPHLIKDVDKYEGTYVKVIVESKEDEAKFDDYFKALENVNVHDLQVIEDTSLDLSDVEIEQIEDTQTIFKSFIEQSDLKVNKEELISFIDEIHNEARNLE